MPEPSTPAAPVPPGVRWVGCVVPKRHARRAVTRNLVKRQVRAAFERAGAALPPGLWLVRLTGVLSPAVFVSARSQRLSQALRGELDALLGGATASLARRGGPGGGAAAAVAGVRGR